MIRALYEWIVDNQCTPVIVVNARAEGTQVPQQYVNNDGQIILNISPGAVINLELGNKSVAFNARFGGIPNDIYVPCYAILGIYARENGQGMNFDYEPPEDPEPDPTGSDPSDEGSDGGDGEKRPPLRIVK